MNCEELHSYRNFAASAVNGFRLFQQPQEGVRQYQIVIKPSDYNILPVLNFSLISAILKSYDSSEATIYKCRRKTD